MPSRLRWSSAYLLLTLTVLFWSGKLRRRPPLAYLFWNRAVAEVGASRAGMFVHLMPVFGTLLAIALLGESFHFHHAMGFALIILGIVLATRTPSPGPLD